MHRKSVSEEMARDIATIRASELFDSDWYMQEYPDVALLGVEAAEHYLRIGARMGRDPSWRFDSRGYVAAYADVERAGVNPLLHYERSGRAEGRKPLPNGMIHTPPAPKTVDAGEKPEPRAIPHYGPVFKRLIDRAKARTRKLGASKEYDLIRSEFDIEYYLMRYPDLARAARLDPIDHYIRAGAREGRDPSPHFSTKAYLKRYPHVKESGMNPFYHWLVVGRAEGYLASPFNEFEGLCEMLGQPPQEVEKLLAARRQDLRDRFDHGVLGEMVRKASQFEPLIAHGWPAAFEVKTPPFHTNAMVSRVVAMHRLHEAADFRRAKIVIAVNRPRWGGARRMEGHIAHALSEVIDPADILIVSTDQGGERPPGRFPEGCRYVDYASAVEKVDQGVRDRLLVEFLRSLRPSAVFNVNSRLLWGAMKPYGKALSASMDIYACLFCNEQTLHGYWTGYPAKFFYRHFDTLAGVCADSHALVGSLAEQFCVPPDQRGKLTVLEAPVDPAQPVAARPRPLAGRRPQVFWSGRFDRQKRLDVVYALARRMPEIDFRMWGEPVLDKSLAGLKKPDNVIHEGVYERFSDLPLAECDLWLYTSEWDGVPSLLLEVAMTGVPIVGSIVGGTGEVLREGLSWRVEDIEDTDAYRDAILDVLSDVEAARQRALRLRETLAAERTTEAYRERLEALLPALQPEPREAPEDA